jgi:hypothetical protein
MRKLSLGLESAPVTWDLLRSVITAITAITHMPVHLTATMDLTTLWAACLSAPARGSVASTVPATVVDFMVGATTAAAAFMDVALADAALPAVVVSGMAVLIAVVSTAEAVSAAAVDFTAVAVASTGAVAFAEAPADSTAVGADFTAEAAGRMVVVEATAAGTGKISLIALRRETAGSIHCQPFSFLATLSP